MELDLEIVHLSYTYNKIYIPVARVRQIDIDIYLSIPFHPRVWEKLDYHI